MKKMVHKLIRLNGCSKPVLLVASILFMLNIHSQEKVILSEKVIINGLPVEVIPYAEGKDVTIKDLKFSDGSISLNYVNRGKQSFTLVLYFQFDDEMLVNYSDTLLNFSIHSSGKVLFSAKGYNQTGQNKTGIIKTYINSNVGGVYDLNGLTGKLYVFAVKGKVFPNSLLPGEQKDEKTFKALSNVLIISVTF